MENFHSFATPTINGNNNTINGQYHNITSHHNNNYIHYQQSNVCQSGQYSQITNHQDYNFNHNQQIHPHPQSSQSSFVGHQDNNYYPFKLKQTSIYDTTTTNYSSLNQNIDYFNCNTNNIATMPINNGFENKKLDNGLSTSSPTDTTSDDIQTNYTDNTMEVTNSVATTINTTSSVGSDSDCHTVSNIDLPTSNSNNKMNNTILFKKVFFFLLFNFQIIKLNKFKFY
jgi:hypothetical protein